MVKNGFQQGFLSGSLIDTMVGLNFEVLSLWKVGFLEDHEMGN